MRDACKPGVDRVVIDVSDEQAPVDLAAYATRPEPAADERSVPMSEPIESTNVHVLNACEPIRELTLEAPDKQMEVSIQQRERVNLKLAAPNGACQLSKKEAAIFPALEECPPGQAAVHHVVPGAGFIPAGSTSHILIVGAGYT